MRLKKILPAVLMTFIPFVLLRTNAEAARPAIIPASEITSNTMSPEQLKREYQTLWNKINSYSGRIFENEPSFQAPYRGSKLNKDYLNLVKEHLNLYRTLAGSPKVRKVYSSKDISNISLTQSVMQKNGGPAISHYPAKVGFRKPADMPQSFYNRYAASAADYHNILSWGAKPVQSLMLYLNEGLRNYTLGHRLELLTPNMTAFDYGATERGYSLHTAGRSVHTPWLEMDKDIYAYPAAGVYPLQSISTREFAWSFIFNPKTIEVTDSLTISIQKEGAPADVRRGFADSYRRSFENRIFRYSGAPYVYRENAYGVATRYSRQRRYPAGKYTVTITGIRKNGRDVMARYTVHMVDVGESATEFVRGNRTLVKHGSEELQFVDRNGQALKDAWFRHSGTQYYASRSGNIAIDEWETVGKKDYRFDKNGQRIFGWVTVDGKKHYIDPVEGRFDGFRTVDGKVRYFDGRKGMVTDEFRKINGKYYYFDREGRRVTGLRTIHGKRYYFDRYGKSVRNGFRTFADKSSYFNAAGVQVRNRRLNVNGKTYRADRNGYILKNTLYTVSGKTEYYGADGAMVKNCLINIHGKTRYFDKNGYAVKNTWCTIRNRRYRFNAHGVAETGRRKIAGKTYRFNRNGVLIR